jgi:hypothetical protein
MLSVKLTLLSTAAKALHAILLGSANVDEALVLVGVSHVMDYTAFKRYVKCSPWESNPPGPSYGIVIHSL